MNGWAMTISEWFSVLMALIVLLAIRVLYANERTFRQRRKMMNTMRDRSRGTIRFWNLMEDYASVTYHQHMWRVVFLRDPFTAYPQRLQDFLSEEGRD